MADRGDRRMMQVCPLPVPAENRRCWLTRLIALIADPHLEDVDASDALLAKAATTPLVGDVAPATL